MVLERQKEKAAAERNHPGRCRFKCENSKPSPYNPFLQVLQGLKSQCGDSKASIPGGWSQGHRRRNLLLLPGGVGALQTPMAEQRTSFFFPGCPQNPLAGAPCLTSLKCGAGFSFLSRKRCSFIRAEEKRSRPGLWGGVPNTGARIPARPPPCSQLTSTLMFSFCERRERTSSTSRLKMAWTRGGCRENQLSGSRPEPERNRGVGEHPGWRGVSLEGLRYGGPGCSGFLRCLHRPPGPQGHPLRRGEHGVGRGGSRGEPRARGPA